MFMTTVQCGVDAWAAVQCSGNGLDYSAVKW
jgi:hypothetical protein